jgi:hypothetical protein
MEKNMPKYPRVDSTAILAAVQYTLLSDVHNGIGELVSRREIVVELRKRREEMMKKITVSQTSATGWAYSFDGHLGTIRMRRNALEHDVYVAIIKRHGEPQP